MRVRLWSILTGSAALASLLGAGAFIALALFKAQDVAGFAKVIASHAMIPHAWSDDSARAVVALELAAGLSAAILVGLSSAGRWRAPALLALVLAAMTAYAGLLTRHPPPSPAPCGCGFSRGDLIDDWSGVLWRNAGLTAGAVTLAALLRLDARAGVARSAGRPTSPEPAPCSHPSA